MSTEKPVEKVEQIDMVQDYFNTAARVDLTLSHLSINLSAIINELTTEVKEGRSNEIREEGDDESRDQTFTNVDTLNRLLKSSTISMAYAMILLLPTTEEGEKLVTDMVEWLTTISKIAGTQAAAHALDLRHQAMHIGQANKTSAQKEVTH